MKKILTIVVPSYNVEKFLPNTLERLTSGDNKSKLEVLVVDDGSTDNTKMIADRYQKKFSSVVRVISKENGGHGSTINVGISNASGKYLKVVDGDDWLDTNQLDIFLDRLEDIDTDLIITPFWLYDNKKKKKILQNSSVDTQNGKAFLVDSGKLKAIPPMHECTFKTEILKKNSITIDENAFYVDVEFVVYPIPYLKDFCFFNIPLYMYRINVGTQSTNPESLIKNKNMHYFVIDQINSYIKGFKKSVSRVRYLLMKKRLSQMIAAQFKIIVMSKIGFSTMKELKSLKEKIDTSLEFDLKYANFPVRVLIKTNFIFYPALHYLALLKFKYTGE
ncbi:glycosyltransferase family 2 protein [Levilactobacillus brevis]|uniref:glycosyltransferase family 2 protein n=1 Tax=Levilactobacillus brevis TaxID=1580 RepID=UPI000A2FC915|nr:glycosyltransferase family 2 protein [Levilactobacillus brevis]ARQ92325.1 hypothetical protein A6F60_00815 [Levilactobacillus brevis]